MTQLVPDQLEEDLADALDNVVPTRGYQMTPLVGIGASAGGIAALQRFFASVPAEPGIAFVVVLHLAAERESIVHEILQRCTSLRVLQVKETVRVQPDQVYVIPPGKAIRSADGHLSLTDLVSPPGRRVPVDLFFRALADTHGPHAAALVLTGGDGDGAIGIKRIKERGGLTIAQDPAEAEHAGMPSAAIATGMVDWILPIDDMAARLLDYFRIEKQLALPPEDAPEPTPASPASSSASTPSATREAGTNEARLAEVLAFLHARTRDFAHYKRPTIVRRIARRMQVNGVTDLAGYLDCLRTRPGEAGALLQDMLVSVTNFFRNSHAFDALAARIPSLFENKGPNDAVRVWVAACATGEEAYSMAMLLTEHARTLDAPPSLQIFATDLDPAAVQTGREAVYPTAIEADVSPERLQRFFVKERDGYRVRRELREAILFVAHDVLKDSPFSRLDLVSCRNLLIYLDPQAQARVLDIFSFAALPTAMLMLGLSESVEDANTDFAVVDRRHRLYARRAVERPGRNRHRPSALALSLDVASAPREGPAISSRFFQQGAAPAGRDGQPDRGARSRSGPAWGELHLKLLEHLGPPSILIDENEDVVHLSPSAGRYLHYGAGEPTRNLPKLLNPALRIELRGALARVTEHGEAAQTGAVPIALDGLDTSVSMRVEPVVDRSAELRLVLFNATRADAPSHADSSVAARVDTPHAAAPDPLAEQLDRELERVRANLRETVEQYEGSTQELKASNEELQAINEELRSAAEELETGREELQSINEELITVNHELKTKVDELDHANSDMQNLMDATAIATIFLDRTLKITLYTPAATRLFNLIPDDIGRPLTDLVPMLQYPQLGEDAARVLERLAPIEREVGRSDGSWFLARLLPYRATEDRIAGVVLSFIDITERKQAEEVSQWLSAVVAYSTDAIISFSLEGRVLSWNSGAERVFGHAADEVVGHPLAMLAGLGDADERTRIVERIGAGQSVENLDTRLLAKDGHAVHVSLTVSPIFDAQARVVGATAIARDVSEARQAAEALRRSDERLRLVMENALDYAIFSTDIDRVVTSWNAGAEQLLGYIEAEAVGRSCDMIFTDEDRAAGMPEHEARTALACGRAADERFHQRKDGTRFWGSGTLMRMHDSAGVAIGFVKILRDETVAREAQAALERSEAELQVALQQNLRARVDLEAADAAKDRFIAVLSHELRNPLASITSAAALLTQADTPEDARARAAQIVQRQSKTMKVLVDDLLDVSRLAVGQLELRQLDLPVAAVIDAAVETALPLIEAAHHDFRVSMPEAPVHLRIDPLRMCQAIVNLLTNAARYTPPGGKLSLDVAVVGDAGGAGEQVEIAVTDNGVGLTAETIDRMFELYSQGPLSPHLHNEGLGVGLALVRNIVKLHGGTIEARSDGAGHGSTFRIRLPVVPAPADPSIALTSMQAASAVSARIMIVDDNTDAAWALSTLLQAAGFDTVTAASGEEALALAERARPALAILDIGMPGMSGVELAEHLRALPWTGNLALMALTGWGESEGADRLRQRFDALFTKPVDMAALMQAIDRLLHTDGR